MRTEPLHFQKHAPWVRRLETLGKEGIPFVRIPRGPDSELVVGINRKGVLGFSLQTSDHPQAAGQPAASRHDPPLEMTWYGLLRVADLVIFDVTQPRPAAKLRQTGCPRSKCQWPGAGPL